MILAELLFAALVVFPVSAAAPVNYTLVAISLPGKGGHGDWVTFDPATNKVYVALHESGVAVVDIGSNSVVADIEPITGPNGIAYDSSYLYAASGDKNTNHLWVGTTAKKVLVLDADTLELVGSALAHGGIDQVVFDPSLRLVYTFESSAKEFDVFNADDLTPVGYVNTDCGNTHTGDAHSSTHRVFTYEGDANILAVYAPPL